MSSSPLRIEFSSGNDHNRDKVLKCLNSLNNLNDSDVIVLNRTDFIADYIGHTIPKTRKVLNEHRGKLIVIEESLTVYLGRSDPFGKEAYTEIHKYITENKDECVLFL